MANVPERKGVDWFEVFTDKIAIVLALGLLGTVIWEVGQAVVK